MFRKFFRRGNESGVTITELLIVAVVFIIAAAIAVPVFTSQRAKMQENELKADLLTMATALDEAKLDNGGKYPEDLPSGISLASKDAVTAYSYPHNRLEYCISISEEGTGTRYYKSSKTSDITQIDCTYEYVLPSTTLAGVMKGFKPSLSWKTVANATSYTIYKNNIPVKTVNAGSSTATSQSVDLPAMLPQEQATFHIVVEGGGEKSGQSNSVILTAPVPTPTKAEIKILSKSVQNPTTMEFVIGWNAVKYAKSYEVYDVTGATPVKVATLSESAGSYSYTAPRGTTKKVIVRAINGAGTSPDSNTLELSSEWAKAKIVSAKSNPATGKIDFVFNEERDGVITPDYGYPDASVRLKITEIPTGKSVYDVSGIKTMKHLTTKAFERVPHRATIIVVTSTGETLSESEPIEIDFPKPSKPSAVTNFTSTNGGEAPLTPNRLKWSAVSCINASSPEYLISHDSENSGWVTGTYFNIPSTWLKEGTKEDFTIVARCSNLNGNSDSSAETATSFTTGLSTPATPKGLTAVNRGDTASWKAVTCATGSSAEYSLKQSIRNNDNEDFAFSPIKGASYDIPGLLGGTDQNFAVSARCVQYDGSGAVKASSSWSAFSGYYAWTTKFGKPLTPVIKQTGKSYSDTTTTEFRIGWNTNEWARTYEAFKVTTRNGQEVYTSIGTFPGNASEGVINVKRGENMKIYVVASNPDYTSAKSNVLTLTDTWPTPKIVSYVADPYEGTIEVKWNTVNAQGVPTPDFGDPDARYELGLVDTVSGAERSFTDLTGSGLLVPDEFVTRKPQIVTLIVTTSTGKVISAKPITIAFPKPGPPASPKNVKVIHAPDAGTTSPNRIVWDTVSCGKATTQYLIKHASGEDSEWTLGTPSGAQTYWDLDEGWLKQGFDTNVTIEARCQNPAGVSGSSPAVSVDFRVKVTKPDVLENIANDGIEVVTWEHQTPPEGLSREYLVKTTTFNGVSSTNSFTTTNDSHTVTELQPNKKQVVTVQVRFYNPANNESSPWSNPVSTTWITPKPVPGTPAIKLVSSNILNSTTQRYNISWSATSWAEGYNIIDKKTGSVLATVNAPGTTANIDLKRGISATTIYAEAFNTSATSPRSNELVLHAPWTTPSILESEAHRNGSTTLKWQSGTQASPTPNWGTPDAKINLEVRKSGSTGEIVYSATGLQTIDHTTTAFANTSSLRNLTYYAKITVTTSTGVVLNSSWHSFKFERPVAPARTNVTSDNNGTAYTAVKPNRLTWNAVTCSQTNSEARYYVITVLPGNTYSSGAEGRTVLMNWKANTTSLDLKAAQLEDMQGQNVAFVVMTGCFFTDNGDYKYNDAIAEGDGYHEFTVGIAPPTTNPGIPTRASAYNDIIKWSTAICGKNTYPEYRVLHAVKNGVSSTTTYALDETSMDLPATAGTNQGVKVQARCVYSENGDMFSTWGPYSGQYDYRSPLPRPTAPSITASGIVYTSATDAERTITWSAVENAEQYVVYNGSTVLATLNASTRTYKVPLVRGSSPAKVITVKAGNFTYPATGNTSSNAISMSAPWPTAVVKTATANQNRQITASWQAGSGTTRSPNWGNDSSSVIMYVTDTATNKVVYTSASTTANSLTSTAIAGSNAKFTVHIVVTTANGEKLTSAKKAVTMNPPAKPSAPTNFTSSTGNGPITPSRLTWTAVSCPTAGSTPEYLIEHIDSEFTDYSSDYFTGTAFNIPQSWLEEARTQYFTIVARCVSANGESDDSATAGHTTARTNIPVPPSATGLKITSNKDNGTAVLDWNAINCPAHLEAGYMVVYSKKNDVSYSNYSASLSAGAYSHAYTNTTANLTGLTPDKAHTAYVKTRCYDPLNTALSSTWASANDSSSVSWTTPIPVPAVPVLKASAFAIDSNDEAYGYITFTWNQPTWATKYYLYKSNGTQVGIYTGTTAKLRLDRGMTHSYYLIAQNANGGRSGKSNTTSTTATYAGIKVTEAGWNSTTGAWNVSWGPTTGTARWGNDAVFNYRVTNSAGTAVYSYDYTGDATKSRNVTLPATPQAYTVKVTVTTGGLKKVYSHSLTRNWVKPPAVPTGLAEYNHNGVKWNAVSCASGSTTQYWITWKYNNGANTGTYTTNNTNFTLSTVVPNQAQDVMVRARCTTTSYGVSDWSAFSPSLKFTSEYPVPTSVPAPTTNVLNSGGPSNKTVHDRLQWSHITCPTGSKRTYTIELTHFFGRFYSDSRSTPWFTKSDITANYYDLTDYQQQAGGRNSWRVSATCTVNLGSATSDYKYTGWTETPIKAPTGAINASDNGWGTVAWNDNMACESGTTKEHRILVMWLNGKDVADYYTDWKTDADSSIYMYTQWGAVYGLKQSIKVQVRCSYDNHGAKLVASPLITSTTITWVPKASQPDITVNSSRTGKWVDFTFTCSPGLDVSYYWTVSKQDDSGYLTSATENITTKTRSGDPVKIRHTWSPAGAYYANLDAACMSQDRKVISGTKHVDHKLQ